MPLGLSELVLVKGVIAKPSYSDRPDHASAQKRAWKLDSYIESDGTHQ